MALTEKKNSDEEYETEGLGGYAKPGDIRQVDQVTDPDIMKIIRGWGIPDPRSLREPPPSEQHEAPPDPDDDPQVADNSQSPEEALRTRRERLNSQAGADDLAYAFMVKRNEKRPEWKAFLEDIGDQARTLSNRQLLAVFTAWNEQRMDDKPAWLNDEEAGPSDLQDLNEKFPPDDRNDAMGPAPEGKYKIPTRVFNGGSS